MKLLTRPFRPSILIIRTHLRAYLLLNLTAYGLLTIGLVSGAVFPDLNTAQTAAMDADGTTEEVVGLLATPWLFAVRIFTVNVTTICLAAILLPSLIVPFAGVAVFAWFALQTGIVLAPVDHVTTMTLIPHSLTMVLEFQAYVLLLLGAVQVGRSWIWPAPAGVKNRRAGYVRGLQQIGWLAVPAVALLIIGAIYEALSLAYLTPLLLAG